jgi:hypothetical protein
MLYTQCTSQSTSHRAASHSNLLDPYAYILGDLRAGGVESQRCVEYHLSKRSSEATRGMYFPSGL